MPDGLPLGPELPGWTPPARPPHMAFEGRYTRLEPLMADRHGAALFETYRADDTVWTYLPYGPYASAAAYGRWIESATAGEDPVFYAVCPCETGRPAGVLSYLRIQPEAGSIEIGHVNFAPALQRTRAATEAVSLLIHWAFEAGYRRVEWKCNALNRASRRAAQRVGLSYEGVFRQQAVVKGRNRDTAWFAAIDSEWPALRAAHERWLARDNFDADGRQITRLGDLTAPLLVAPDPALG